MTKKNYAVLGLHCSTCPMVIEGELEDIGVKASCSYAKARLEVEFDETSVTEETIARTVKASGYELQEV